jgi:protein SCO1/2
MSGAKAAAVLVALALTLAGCGRGGPQFQTSDVTGSAMGRDLALTDHTGKARTLADFRGKAVVVFFGYTQCPDVCPTTLATLAEALRRLGPDAAKDQVLFVTIDPERDTAELLSHYVTAFDPSFLGLAGDAEATARTAKEFKVIYQKQPGSTPGSYTMDHSAGTFIFDPEGRLRLYAGHGKDAEFFAHDLRELLRTAARVSGAAAAGPVAASVSAQPGRQ